MITENKPWLIVFAFSLLFKMVAEDISLADRFKQITEEYKKYLQ